MKWFSSVEKARAGARLYHTRSDGTPRQKRLRVTVLELWGGEFYEVWDHELQTWVPADDAGRAH